jgi:hypothetical protein
MTALPRHLVDRLTIWNALLALADAPIALGPRARLVMALRPPQAPPPPANALR